MEHEHTQFGGLDDQFTETLVKDATPTPWSEIFWLLVLVGAAPIVVLGAVVSFFFLR